KVTTAPARPTVRSALVAPIRPDPCSRRSTPPANRPTSRPNGSAPTRYASRTRIAAPGMPVIVAPPLVAPALWPGGGAADERAQAEGDRHPCDGHPCADVAGERHPA